MFRLKLILSCGGQSVYKFVDYPLVPRVGDYHMVAPGFTHPFREVICVQHAHRVMVSDPEFYSIISFPEQPEEFFDKLAASAQGWKSVE